MRPGLWTTALDTVNPSTIGRMGGLPDPEWYLEHVLDDASPGGPAAVLGPVGRWQADWRDRLIGADPVLLSASRQGFVLTTTQLADVGVSRSATRTAVRQGRWTAPARGVVAPLSTVGPDDRRQRHALAAAAAWLNRPDHVVAERSAAVLHGLPVLRLPDTPCLLTPGRGGLGRRGNGHAFGARLDAGDVGTWYGVPVTTVARTLVDLARHEARGGIMAADAALRERLVTRRAMDAALAGAAGWPGVRAARAVLALADPDAESPLESIVRLALHRSGFPPPALQYVIGRYRVDFCWPEHRLVLEADGRGKYTGDALWQEKRREHAVRAAGYRVERVLWSDVTRDWSTTSERLWTALRST